MSRITAGLTMVDDHGNVIRMKRAVSSPPPESVSISEFKAKCLALLDRVGRTGRPLLVTRRGQPIAEVVKPSVPRSTDWIGSAASTARIVGDIVGPAVPPGDWDVLKS
jgi:prevent-host-death family protein